MDKSQHWIAGRPVPPAGGAHLQRLSPATGAPIAAYALGNAADVDAAVAAARRAHENGAWRDAPGSERARVLGRFADLMAARRDEIAALEAEEAGKPIRVARGEVDYAIDLTRFAASCAWNIPGEAMSHSGPDKLGLVLHEPKGVVALIIPWNFPVVCLIQKLPYALAAGCAVVVKPSEMTSGTTLLLARLLQEAGLPDGQFNVVTGTGEEAGEALVTHAGVDMISFTGSTAVGKRVAGHAASAVKRVALELGGKGANIVFADADLEAAVEGAFQGFTINKGEECCAGSRILVERPVLAAFKRRLVERCAQARLGPPLDEATDLGPLVSQRQLDRVLGYIETGKAEGATLIAGGARATDGLLAKGYFVPPTLFSDVTPGMTIYREEVFGPVAAIVPFDGVDEAVRIANDTLYGLANGVWTTSLDKAMAVVRRIRSGMVYVNTFLETVPQLPFGGMKQSGIGRENGVAGMMEFMEVKAAFIRLKATV